MKVGNRFLVVGPIEWLRQVGCDNRIDQVCMLVNAEPADIVQLDRGNTNVFRVKFMDSLPGMFHHVPGPCLEDVEMHPSWENKQGVDVCVCCGNIQDTLKSVEFLGFKGTVCEDSLACQARTLNALAHLRVAS